MGDQYATGLDKWTTDLIRSLGLGGREVISLQLNIPGKGRLPTMTVVEHPKSDGGFDWDATDVQQFTLTPVDPSYSGMFAPPPSADPV